MPFTTLNQVAKPQSAPPWIRAEFNDLQPDVIDLIEAFWNGQAHALTQTSAQAIISQFRNLVHNLKDKVQQQDVAISSSRAESPSKKRSLEDTEGINGHSEKKPRIPEASSVSGSWKGIRFDGVSFTIPQRKKLSLTISSSRNEGLLVTAQGSEVPEFGIPWDHIEDLICLPVPEKTQAQKSFVVFPKGINGLSETSTSIYEPMVWTVPDTRAKGASEDEPTQAQAIKDALMQSFKVLEPDPKDFTSEIPPAGGKKGDKAYHIKAFKGSKDGHLFLLPNGILWAFKKPLIFFSFSSIDSISYTSVLQRTFNLVISARSSSEASPIDYEFSMLDQADFAGIDAYIKKNGLQDASLAEQRRAKVYNVNGKKGEVVDATAEDGEPEGELQKAEREAEGVAAPESSDDEEEDENFDPGSDGESEGSGSGSEDEDDAAGDDDDGAADVEGDLGSEAENEDMDDEG